jgi:DNA replication protein DnaC
MILTCIQCGREYDCTTIDWMKPDTLERYKAECAKCPSCANAGQQKSKQEQEAEQERETRRKLMENYRERIAESQLDVYRLEYDPNHPQANRELMTWMIQHEDNSVWIVGESGTGKTRIMQDAARDAARDRTVRFWPVADLAARLLETAKRPEQMLWDTYTADLLILDDLGKENLTAARLASLEAIVDHRYIGWDQMCRRQGTDCPRFWCGTAKNKLGGQLWISSQIGPEEMVERLSAVNKDDAAAIVRRLAEMCVLHRC